ncbi:SRPBCC domain-containing protein [Microbacterium sp. KSW4-11]|uniref:SRPBCC domain-containing protein n=1 Tax=Microbacterium gawkjiense TaxID=3067309 RepID=A0ABU3GCH3_9MICO|nr:SRPBCC domain-containing protein [Microbacterium sp. KSW4-11]MDT3317503.1 SRPBCC domain-containing protein [Microbacterium sp. KSW4-11]
MVGDSLTVVTEIRASVEDVWRCLTVGRSAWWPEMRFEAVVGSPLVETWVEDGRQGVASGSVTHCVEPHVLGFRWSEDGWDGPLDVEIELVGHGDSTSVRLTESGFSGVGTPDSLQSEHEAGWRYHLARLKSASEARAVDADVS